MPPKLITITVSRFNAHAKEAKVKANMIASTQVCASEIYLNSNICMWLNECKTYPLKLIPLPDDSSPSLASTKRAAATNIRIETMRAKNFIGFILFSLYPEL